MREKRSRLHHPPFSFFPPCQTLHHVQPGPKPFGPPLFSALLPHGSHPPRQNDLGGFPPIAPASSYFLNPGLRRPDRIIPPRPSSRESTSSSSAVARPSLRRHPLLPSAGVRLVPIVPFGPSTRRSRHESVTRPPLRRSRVASGRLARDSSRKHPDLNYRLSLGQPVKRGIRRRAVPSR
jgi:hypothetical protein